MRLDLATSSTDESIFSRVLSELNDHVDVLPIQQPQPARTSSARKINLKTARVGLSLQSTISKSAKAVDSPEKNSRILAKIQNDLEAGVLTIQERSPSSRDQILLETITDSRDALRSAWNDIRLIPTIDYQTNGLANGLSNIQL